MTENGKRTDMRSDGRRRLIAYLRVSTAGQEENTSFGEQARQIDIWAQRHGFTIVKTFQDVVSGTTQWADRPGLVAAVEMLNKGGADGIVVLRIDRLMRDQVGQEFFCRYLWGKGWQIHSTDDVENQFLYDDDADPARKLVRTILSAVAEYERDLIRLRLLGGKRAKMAANGFGGGTIPYGLKYDPDADELVVDPDEQAVIEQMCAWRADGRAFHWIATRLNETGVPSKRGGLWRAHVVDKIVTRLAPSHTRLKPIYN